MEVRVGGTHLDQHWRVTGLTEEDVAPAVPHVILEFWIGDDVYKLEWVRRSFDPELAWKLGQHLMEMAQHSMSD